MTPAPVRLLYCLTIPILVTVACGRWTRISRRELPHWRNGIGLASIVVVSTEWFLYTAIWMLSSVSFQLTRFYDATWMQMQMYFDLAALPLAFALKGVPRLLMVAAWFLIQVYRGSFFIA